MPEPLSGLAAHDAKGGHRFGGGPPPRAVGANARPLAALVYRLAVEHLTDRDAARVLLRAATRLDPGFVVAAADLSFLSGRPLPSPGGGRGMWDRHHVEVLDALLGQDRSRALALGALHLQEVDDPFIRSVLQQRAPWPGGRRMPAAVRSRRRGRR